MTKKSDDQLKKLMESLGFEVVDSEELLSKVMDGENPFSSKEFDEIGNLCHCGTLREAYEAGTKQAIQLVASDCPVWAFQVGSMIVFNALTLLAQGVSAKDHIDSIQLATMALKRAYNRENVSAEDLMSKIELKMKDMN